MAQYNPKLQYQWPLDAEITFTGREFDIMNRAIGGFLNSSMDVPSILRLVESFGVIQKKMNEYVEKGVMTEYVEPVPATTE